MSIGGINIYHFRLQTAADKTGDEAANETGTDNDTECEIDGTRHIENHVIVLPLVSSSP